MPIAFEVGDVLVVRTDVIEAIEVLRSLIPKEAAIEAGKFGMQ